MAIRNHLWNVQAEVERLESNARQAAEIAEYFRSEGDHDAAAAYERMSDEAQADADALAGV